MALFGEGAVRDADTLLKRLDDDGDASIDFVEFLGLMVSRDSLIQADGCLRLAPSAPLVLG